MKIIDLAVLFCFIFLGVSLSIDISQRKLVQAEEYKKIYNEIMYIATEDATGALIEASDETDFEELANGYLSKNANINLNIEKAVSTFYKSVYLNMGIENNKIAQQGFKEFLPVKIVVANDGFYVNTCEEVQNETGKQEIAEIWLPEKPYTFYDKESNLVINFTLSEYVYIFDIKTGNYFEGKACDMEKLYPESKLFIGTDKIFDSYEFKNTTFDKVRRQTIVNCVRSDLEFYTYKYNNLAKQKGRSYSFNIPYISSDQWKNSIESICFIAFLQGFPVGPDRYSTFGFGGSKIVKKDIYYSTGEAFNGGFYHLKNCPLLNDANVDLETVITESFNKKAEAAEAGYHPCRTCKP